MCGAALSCRLQQRTARGETSAETRDKLCREELFEANKKLFRVQPYIARHTSVEQQQESSEMLDELDNDDGRVPLPEGIEEALLKEEEMLEALPLSGVPGHEKARREKRLKIPRRARAAIRKMHKE